MESEKTVSSALLDVEDEIPSPQKPSSLLIVNKDKESSKPKTAPKIVKMPPSSVLAQARAFLPMLQKANDELGKSDMDVNIENVDEDKPHVAMEFALTEETGSEDENDPVPSPNPKAGIEEL
eukprot:CFRG5527T1